MIVTKELYDNLKYYSEIGDVKSVMTYYKFFIGNEGEKWFEGLLYRTYCNAIAQLDEKFDEYLDAGKLLELQKTLTEMQKILKPFSLFISRLEGIIDDEGEEIDQDFLIDVLKNKQENLCYAQRDYKHKIEEFKKNCLPKVISLVKNIS